MSTLSKEEIRSVLLQRGFASDGLAREHSESFTLPGDETVKLKRTNSFPLVIHPRHEGIMNELLAIPGVIASPDRLAHNSNFVGFHKRLHTGKQPIAFGLDFGFDSNAALQAFLGRLIPGQDLAWALFDPEARAFLDGFLAADNPQRVRWLPRYRLTLDTVRAALQRNAPEEVFDLVWKSFDNAVSNAGQGILGFEAVDRWREPLVEMLGDIGRDGGAGQFDQLLARLQQWKQAGDLPKVPRLLLARAFAAIHPERYHTTVDVSKQDRILPWFEAHTGFVAPAGNWATRAQALTLHLDQSDVFDGQRELRNMFPWYVFEQLRDADGRVPFRHGHVSRAPSGQMISPEQTRTIEYRQNVIQDRLVAQLHAQYGDKAVATEHPTGTGGRADALLRHDDGSLELYEIKPATTAREAVRQALGQLLEYAYRRNGLKPKALHVVSDAALDEVTADYLQTLQDRFGLRFGYLHVASSQHGEVGSE